MKVAIAYSSDLDQALSILNRLRPPTAPRAGPAAEPGAFVTGFGADGMDLEVGFWIRDPEEGTLAVRSAIARAVLQRFADAGVGDSVSAPGRTPDRGGASHQPYRRTAQIAGEAP